MFNTKPLRARLMVGLLSAILVAIVLIRWYAYDAGLIQVIPGLAFAFWQAVTTFFTPESMATLLIALYASVAIAAIAAVAIWRVRLSDSRARRLAEVLQQDKSALVDILDVTLSGYWDWYIQENREYLSPTFKSMFGYEDHELENSPVTWQKLIFKEDLPGVLEAFDKHVKSHGEYPFYNEVRYHHKDGSTVWVICSGRVVEWDDQDRPIRMVGCHVDITDRRKAEAGLLETEDRFRQLFLNAPLAYHSLDETGYFVDVNDEWLQLLGYTREAIIGEHFRKVLVPSEHELLNRRFTNFLKTGQVADVEFNLIRNDGSQVTIILDGRIQSDDMGRFQRTHCIIKDITAQKKAEEIIAGQKQVSDNIISSLPGVFYVYDEQGRLIRWNKTLEEVSGYSSQELFSMTAGDFFDGDDKKLVAERIGNVFSGGQADVEAHLVTKAGDRIPYHFTGVRTTLKGAPHLLGVGTDVTARKEAERRQQFVAEILESLNVAATDKATISSLLGLIKDFTRVDAVGIRLQDGMDFPYYETIGFSDGFVEKERHLCARHKNGEIMTDPEGNPILECMCGNVICGRFDSDFPFFTGNGSFWTNGTTELLATTTEDDRQAPTRNRCNAVGYESVALIPLRSAQKTIGLLQLNHMGKNKFTEDYIKFFEEIGNSIGIALSRKMVEDKLHDQNVLMNALIDSPNDIIIFSLDKEYRYTAFNNTHRHEMLRIYGTRISMGQSILEVMADPKICQMAKPSFDRALQGERFVEIQGQPDQDIFYEFNWSPIKSDSGEIEGISAFVKNITEQKRSEEELRSERVKAQKYLDVAGTMLIALDTDQRITLINNAGCEMLGYASEELIGKNWFDTCVPPRMVETVKAKFNDLMSTTPVSTEIDIYENQVITRDGEERLIAWYNTLLTDQNDKIIGTLSSGADITERKQMEETLKSSLELLHMMETATIDEIMQYSLEEGERLTNSQIAYFHFVNPDQETITLKTWSRNSLNYCSVDGETQDYSIDQAGVWVDCIRRRKPVIHNNYESLPHKKGLPDGHVPVIRDLGLPVFEGGKIVAVLGVGNKPSDYTQFDIDQLSLLATSTWSIIQRKRAEERVKEERDFSETLIQSSPTFIVTIDADGRTRMMNKAMLDTIGYSASEVIGMDYLATFVPEDERAILSGTFETIVEMDAPTLNENHILCKDGSQILVEWRGRPVHRKNGDFDFFFGVGVDITERKKAETLLRKHSLEDGLTGLANRRQFDQVLEKEWQRAVRDNKSLSLVMVDVDHFKKYNDLYGHQQGDECLRLIGQCLKAIFRRPADLIARYGGEEFVAILPDTESDGSAKIAESIRKLVLTLNHPTMEEHGPVSISLGVATICPDADSTATGLVEKADQALYQAKSQGRNRVSVWSDALTEALHV